MRTPKKSKCYDKFDKEIFEDDFLDVQTDPVFRNVYLKA